MGCGSSSEKVGGVVNGIPKVSAKSWYGQPFTGRKSVTYRSDHGKVRFGATESCLDPPEDAHRPPGRASNVEADDTEMKTEQDLLDFHQKQTSVFVADEESIALGTTPLYACGILFADALKTEHTWRLRAEGAVGLKEEQLMEQPQLYLGVKIFIDDQLVPDRCPHSQCLSQCTWTNPDPTAAAELFMVPIVLWPTWRSAHNADGGRMFTPLIYNFLTAVAELKLNLNADSESEIPCSTHDLRVETAYGDKECNFCTEFTSKGQIQFTVTRWAQDHALRHAAHVRTVAFKNSVVHSNSKPADH